jgi:hypothetical protein
MARRGRQLVEAKFSLRGKVARPEALNQRVLEGAPIASGGQQ